MRRAPSLSNIFAIFFTNNKFVPKEAIIKIKLFYFCIGTPGVGVVCVAFKAQFVVHATKD